MPAAREYDPTDKKYREAAVAERAERQVWHAKAWQYYYGEHPKPLKTRAGRPDNNVIINLVAQHADHTISFAAPSFPELELDPETDTPQEESLAAFWLGAGESVWLSNTMLAGLLGGHVFCRMLPPSGPGALPRVVTLNPANVLVAWADDDYETPLWYEVYFRAGAMLRRQDIIAPGVFDGEVEMEGGVKVRPTDGQWVIRSWEQPVSTYDNLTPKEWTAIGTPEIWPYECPPIIDWQHLPRPGAYYGGHELGSLSLNDAVNKVASDIKAILRIHAAPRRVAIGIPPGAIKDTAIDNFWAIDGKTPAEVDIKSLEMESDLASSMAFIQFLSDAYMQQARVTILNGGPDAYKNITNLGIKAAFMSQLGKTETLQRQYGEGIAQISAAALEMMGEQPQEPDVQWKPALPVSEMELTQTQIMQLNNALQSRQGAAAKLGIDYTKVQEQLASESVTVEALMPGATVGVSG